MMKEGCNKEIDYKMKAMILCAGLGTRLKPWTLTHPKALVPVGGTPMLLRVAEKLSNFGFTDLTINIHHFPQQIIDYVSEGHLSFATVNISDESEHLLDTGGGILNAEKYLCKDDAPFLVHNVDILSNADLNTLYSCHVNDANDVTLLMSDRVSTRKLVFRPDMSLKGWINNATGECRPINLQIASDDKTLAFSGIYVMSPCVFSVMKEHDFSGKFSIMDFLLAGIPGVKIAGFQVSDLQLIDIGKPETLHEANLRMS